MNTKKPMHESKTVREIACAKLNLFLSVGKKRSDGYHELLTFMRRISLADTVTVSLEQSDHTDISLSVSGEEGVPFGADNLVYRAASAFLTETEITARIAIKLEKRIPVQAGLGGGSSDAAAILRTVNRLSGYPLSEAQLCALAAGIGSDVPFFISQNAALCSGRGEKLLSIPVWDSPFVVIVEGKEKSDTTKAYHALDEWKKKNKNYFLTKNLPDFYHFSYVDVANDFEVPVSVLCPSVTEHLSLLRRYGAVTASMSGSGSSVFGLFSDEKTASEAARKIGSRARLCRLLAD